MLKPDKKIEDVRENETLILILSDWFSDPKAPNKITVLNELAGNIDKLPPKCKQIFKALANT